MDNEPPGTRCPACGSGMTRQLSAHLWECRYHLCRLVFPMGRTQNKAQTMLVAEEEVKYRPGGEKE